MKSGPKTEFFDQLKVLFPDNKNDIDKYHEIVKVCVNNFWEIPTFVIVIIDLE